MDNKPAPQSVQLDTAAITVQWKDGHRSVYSCRQLRLRCPCAQCIDEWSGAARLDPASVPVGIHAVDYMPIGNYAVQFLWSDAHYTGLYTHEFLRATCPCQVCIAEAGFPPQ